MKTVEDVIEFVYDKLMTQGKQALDEDGSSCMYRAPDGCKCAVGWLIPDEDYDPSMEGLKSYSGVISKLLSKQFDAQIVMDVLPYLQSIHDRYRRHIPNNSFRQHIHIAFTNFIDVHENRFTRQIELKGVKHYEV